MHFKPLRDRVVVRPIEADEKTSGGVIIPDTAKERPMQGEIVAVGAGRRDRRGALHPLDLEVGDRVLFGKWSGTEVTIEGGDFLVLKDTDVLGVIDAGAEESEASENGGSQTW